MMLLLVREPRAFLFPYGEPGPTGDVIEAFLGLCDPDRKRARDFRDKFGATWGLTPDDLRTLHARLEDVIRAVAKLVLAAHHHRVARDAGCPTDWQSM